MPSISVRTLSWPASVPVLTVILALCACSDQNGADPLAQSSTDRSVSSTGAAAAVPGRRDAGSFPLAVGNEWHYAGSFRVTAVEGGEDSVWTEIDRTEFHHVIGTETRPQGEYRLIEQIIHESDNAGAETIWWERFRQTRAGLFVLNIPLNDPPLDAPAVLRMPVTHRDAAWAQLAVSLPAGQREAYRRAWNVLCEKQAVVAGALGAGSWRRGGPRDNEIVRLVYPLHPGRSWVVREDPHFEAFVEGSEQLDLAIGRTHAWRIRIDSDLFSPADRVIVWYGASGFLGQSVHTVVTATDENGNPIGTFISDDSLVLTDVSLNRSRGDQ
jgi:hypothetical protein